MSQKMKARITMNKTRPHILFILLLAAAAPASAGQAYTWTDSEGVTHFSESLPAEVAGEAERVDLPPAPVTPSLPPDRYKSISNQASRMQADRLKREQARDKRRLIEAKRQQARTDAENAEMYEQSSGYSYIYPYPYWYGPRPRHPRRHHYPHPRGNHHPPARFDFQPGKTITQQRNQEALRNQQYRW
jgi:hypothetical protein